MLLADLAIPRPLVLMLVGDVLDLVESERLLWLGHLLLLLLWLLLLLLLALAPSSGGSAVLPKKEERKFHMK